MENLMEMEYVINGEKYLVTVTKVEETNDDCTNCTCDVENAPIDMSQVLPEFNDIEIAKNEETLVFSVSDIPIGIDVETWLNIIEKYNVVLTK